MCEQDRFSAGLSVYLMNGVGGPAGSKGVAKRCTEAIRTVGPTLIIMALIALGTTANAQSAPERQVTFTKDVAPILQRSCQICHRPGSIAPMSLLKYEEGRPWVKAIKENTRPFSIKTALTLLPDSDLFEYVCAENEKDRAHLGK